MGQSHGAAGNAVVHRAGWESGTRTDVFGVSCFRGTLAEATALVVRNALDGAGGYACLCNVHVLETARREPPVWRALSRAQVVFPDGAPIAWAQRLISPGPAERVGGPDLLENVVRAGSSLGLRHAFYGSTTPVLDKLTATLRRRYPSAQVVSAIAPPYGTRSHDEIAGYLAQLRRARPHIVWVGLGAPRQELWSAQHAGDLAPATVVGVGAALDFLSGSKPRAPLWMQDAGLEWLHRLLAEPRRLGLRYLTTNSRYVLRGGGLLIRVALGGRRSWS
jgi:N-acetylglucosaminyldiphosphoundecaprenol N-acetyl-beta-D-mannosaminyltransferase